MDNFINSIGNFFMNIILAIKNFFSELWNIIINFLSKYLPDGVDIAFAIILVAALIIILFKLFIAKGSN